MLNYLAASPSTASVCGYGCVCVISNKLKTGSKKGRGSATPNRCLTLITLLTTLLTFQCGTQVQSSSECQLSTPMGCCSEGTPCSFQSSGTGSCSSHKRLRYLTANEPQPDFPGMCSQPEGARKLPGCSQTKQCHGTGPHSVPQRPVLFHDQHNPCCATGPHQWQWFRDSTEQLLWAWTSCAASRGLERGN